MPASFHAVLLAAEGGAAETAIRDWLLRHGAAAVRCPDAFALCVVLRTRPELACPLAFIDLDRLADEELIVIEYLARTWPGARIIAFGRGCDQRWPADVAAELLPDGVAPLRALLAEHDPVSLRGRVAVRAASPLPPAARPRAAAPDGVAARGEGPASVEHSTALTQEELAALLEDLQE